MTTMIKEFIAEAATIEAATQAATRGLAAPETADVKYEVLAQPKKKTLGLFGGSPARVRAYYEAPDPAPVKKPAAAPAEPKAAPKAEKSAPAAAKSAPKAEKPVPQAESAAEEQPASARPQEEKAEAALVYEPVSDDDTVGAYLKKIVTLMGLTDAQITVAHNGKSVAYSIESEGDQGLLIGRRGETLDALQYLCRLVANRSEKTYDHVAINVGNYREKRETGLRSLAKRSAARVLKYGKNVSLEPMNPYERRIIHTAIQEIEGVQSFSVGSDASRRVVIALQEGVQPTNPSRGGYNNNRSRSRGGYNNRSRGGYNNRSRGAYVPRETPDRAPKNDAAGSGLYGKIEVRKPETEE